MESDRIKWNERYSGEEWFFSLAPSKFLARSLDRIMTLTQGRRALDIACGEGRNAIYLAQHGFVVDAIDIAERGLERGRGRAEELGLAVNFIHADLERHRIDAAYDLILNFNFLLRPLIPQLVASLAPGGVILMETILAAPGLQGEHKEDFLLKPGELERIFSAFPGAIHLLEEEPDPAHEMPVARVMFSKAD